MKTYMPLSVIALSCTLISFSCSKEAEPLDNEIVNSGDNGPVQEDAEITLSAVLSDNLTKVAFDPVYSDGSLSSLSLTWAEGDIIRVYNHDDRTLYQDFTLKPECIGQKEGKFVGTAISAEKYDVELFNGVVGYAAQTQPSDGVASNLKYLASASEVDDYTHVVFSDFSSVLAITAKMPSSEVAAAVKSMEIVSSESVFNGGKTLSVTFDTPGDAGSDGILTFFATLPQGNSEIPAGTSIVVHFNAPDTDHTVYTRYAELPAGEFKAAKLNSVKVNASESATHAGVPACDGTDDEKAYLVGDKYQMQAMRSLMPTNSTRFFKMVDDIDLENEEWTPLNYNDSFTRKIDFDGCGHTIYNLKSSGTYASFTGVLHGILRNVTFDGANISGTYKKGVVAGFLGTTGIPGSCENVTVKNATVYGSSYAGGFAGHVRSTGSVTGCYVENSTVSSNDSHVGGFAAYADITGDDKYEVPARFVDCHVVDVTVNQNYEAASSSICTAGFMACAHTGVGFTDCTVKAVINATKAAIDDVGGFVGRTSYACPTFNGCRVLAGTTVTAKSSHVGGFIGYSSIAASYTDCSSAAVVVNSSEYTGGFVGYSAGASSYNACYASGNVTSTKHAGGFVGTAENSGFSDCYYTGGTVTEKNSGKAQSGGFCGLASTGVLFRGCYVKDAVFSSASGTYVGGFIGQLGYSYVGGNGVSATHCHVEGTAVTGSTNCGGFVGVQYDDISNSYVSGGSVTAKGAHCGGFSGFVQNGDIIHCYTTSSVNGGSYAQVGGFAGIVYKTAISYCYETGSVSGTGSDRGAFVGKCEQQSTNPVAAVSNCIAWNSTLPFCATNNVGASLTDNYAGTEGSVSSQAQALSWPEAVWDLNSSTPELLDTPRRINAIFIGDSITWQWALTSRTDAKTKILIPIDPLPSYMTASGDNITTRFHPGFFTANAYLDKGVSGQNSTQMLTRFKKDIVDLNPVVTVIMAGTNDLAQGVSKEQIVANIAAMAEMADEAGIKVVLCTVTPCNVSYSKLSNPKTKGAHIITLNGMLKDYADSKGFIWCDYWSHLVADDGLALADEYCLYDRLHPGPAGYTVMEGIIKPIIDSLL